MPHTSRRKKRDNGRKRTEVIDDEGWTRVTTKRLSKIAPEPHPVTGREYSPSRDPFKEPYFDSRTEADSSEAPPGASVEKITQRYEKVKRLWLLSDSFAALQAGLRQHPGTAHRIENCTMFGAGSYCGLRQGWIERHEVALVQTAAFASAVELIEQAQGSRPSCFAQEPQYNSVDKAFLATLGITAVDDPIGFEQLPQHSFVYTPGAEQAVQLRVLYRAPDSLLTSEIDLYYRNTDGVAYPRHTAVANPGKGEYVGLPPSPKDVESNQSLQSDHENGARICERFFHDHDCVRLPELEMTNHPFHRQFLYYPMAGEEA